MEFLWKAVLLIITTSVIFVNGWTDAPNAITSAVSTGAISYRRAVTLAAACNLLGILIMGWVNASVADTMLSIAHFNATSPRQTVAALCAAMLSIVLFAVTAWVFGIPTSESHALIAGLTGSALALGGGSRVDGEAWAKVLEGLALSLILGFALGFALPLLLRGPLSRCKAAALRRFQVAAAGCMAFMHGAQDGQKFIAVLVTVDMLAAGQTVSGLGNMREHWLALLYCAVVMALGTAVGGRRIIETVGKRMVALRPAQGICADLAGALCLLAASLWGIPMSTTHTKTTAIMGAGVAFGRRGANGGVIGRIFLAWGITFPVCGFVGYGLTKLFLFLGA